MKQLSGVVITVFFLMTSVQAGGRPITPATGFLCSSVVTPLGCRMRQCEGSISAYSQPILVTIPGGYRSLGIHFHGFKLGTRPAYEQSLDSMITAFGLKESLCAQAEITIFPASAGRCETYKTELLAPFMFNLFLDQIASSLRIDFGRLPLRLSAHSGGGAIIASLLSQSVHTTGSPGAIERVREAIYYDALYSEGQLANMEIWYRRNPEAALKIVSVTSSPRAYAGALISRLTANHVPDRSSLILHSEPYSEFVYRTQPQFLEYLTRTGTEDIDHYRSLSETWEETHR